MDLKHILSFALFLCASTSALAQKDVIFGNGQPFVFAEQDLDKRFARSRMALALKKGTQDANCVQVLGGLLTALAEAAPYLHSRDENFMLDPYLLESVNTQLTNPRFPGGSYLTAMIRRVMIDRKLPDEWMVAAETINPAIGTIDMGKLRLLQEGVQPIESLYFTLEKLKERHDIEVVKANSVSRADSMAEFRDAYVDRFVAWGGLKLVDISAPKKSKRKKKAPPAEPSALVALLHWQPPQPQPQNPMMLMMGSKKPRPLKVYARLAPTQFIDITKLPRGKRLLVRGQFWELNKDATEFEIRNAQLFEDRDWSAGSFLANPQAVFACPFASNDLTGLAPDQPGGFGHR